MRKVEKHFSGTPVHHCTSEGFRQRNADTGTRAAGSVLRRGTYCVGVSIGKTVAKLAGCTALGGVLLAGVMFPAAGGFGYVSNRAADTVDNSSAELVEGVVPAVTTMTDAAGTPIAWLYDQRRFEVRATRSPTR